MNTKVQTFKMPFSTTHFNENQQVWVIYNSGALASYVTGKFRGKNRYVKAWVKWESKIRKNPIFKEIYVHEKFAERRNLLTIEELL